MTKHPYLIMVPPYRHNSAGIRAIYELRRHLEERGYKARGTTGESAPVGTIVVYPEVVPGNPMNGETVVRYVLNYPGLLGGDKSYDPREIIFAFLPRFYPGAPVLTIPVIEDFFRDEGLPRSGGCFWVGKGRDVPRIPETEGLTEITYDWPASREELAKLFNEKEYFLTYDSETALISEARRCGCWIEIISGPIGRNDYDESVKDFDAQLDEFIRITQEAAGTMAQTHGNDIKISFGCLTNHPARLDMVLAQSELTGKAHFLKDAESATKGLNKLLEKMEAEGADVAVLTHQDMSYRRPWMAQVRAQLALLPDSWVTAGIVGKDMEGRTCGIFHDTRIPPIITTADIHTFPHAACCFDECCIFVNLHKGFRFDESLAGWDLYGTLAVLQTWEMGGTAWVIDSGACRVKISTPHGLMVADIAFAEHHLTRSLLWQPSRQFLESFKMLHDKYSGKWRVDSTAIQMSADPDERAKQTEELLSSVGNRLKRAIKEVGKWLNFQEKAERYFTGRSLWPRSLIGR